MLEEQDLIAWSLFPDQTFSHFFVGRNDLLLQSLHPSVLPKVLYIWGKEMCGKTHFLSACFNRFKTKQCVFFLSGKENLLHNWKLLENVDFDILLIDDIHLFLENKSWELVITQFINELADTQKNIIVSSLCPPSQLSLFFNDLKTRLASGLVYHLEPPAISDREKIVKHWLESEAFSFDEAVLKKMVIYFGHNMQILHQYVGHLKRESMLEKKKITTRFVNAFIQKYSS